MRMLSQVARPAELAPTSARLDQLRSPEEQPLHQFLEEVLEQHGEFDGPAGADAAQSRSYLVERLGLRTDLAFKPAHDLLCVLSAPAGDPAPLQLVRRDTHLEDVVLDELVLTRAVRGWMDTMNRVLAGLDQQVRYPMDPSHSQ